LIRPGRIDRKVLFGYASHEVAGKLYARIFKDFAEQYDIPALAKAFADQIPAERITPAKVQGHLLQNRTDPTGAVEKTAQFAEETLDAKVKGANVASFANEVDGALAANTATSQSEASDEPADEVDADTEMQVEDVTNQSASRRPGSRKLVSKRPGRRVRFSAGEKKPASTQTDASTTEARLSNTDPSSFNTDDSALPVDHTTVDPMTQQAILTPAAVDEPSINMLAPLREDALSLFYDDV